MGLSPARARRRVVSARGDASDAGAPTPPAAADTGALPPAAVAPPMVETQTWICPIGDCGGGWIRNRETRNDVLPTVLNVCDGLTVCLCHLSLLQAQLHPLGSVALAC